MIAKPGTRNRNCRDLPSRTRTELVARPGNRYIKRRYCDYTRQSYIASECGYNLPSPGDDAERCLLRPSARGSLRHAREAKTCSKRDQCRQNPAKLSLGKNNKMLILSIARSERDSRETPTASIIL